MSAFDDANPLVTVFKVGSHGYFGENLFVEILSKVIPLHSARLLQFSNTI